MKRFAYVLFFVVFVFVFSVKDLNAQGRNSITGFIFGEARTPLSNVYVELMSDTYSTIGRIRTNGSGLYSFRGLAEGQYMIRVLTSGTDYEEQTTSVSLRPVSAAAGSGAMSEQVDFYLRVRKSRNNTPLGAPGVVFAQEIPDEAKKLYEQAVVELDDKKDSGLEKLRKSIEIFSDYYLALDRLGGEYLKRGYYAEASALYAKALSVNSKSFSSMLGLGIAAYRLNQIDEAVKNLKNSLTLNKESINAHLWLGIALQSKNDLSEALASLIAANKLSQGVTAEVHFQLARVYKDMKDFQKSANELELFLKYSPDAKNAAEIKQLIGKLRAKQ